MNYKNLVKKYPNKVAVITGANNGLGLSLTSLLLIDGWKIIAIDLETAVLDEFKNESLLVYQQDITDHKAYKELLFKVFNTNQVDILFNNAGVGEASLVKDYSIENWEWITNVNFYSLINGTHVALPFFLEKNEGMVVNIASAAGFANLPKMAPYNVTKAGVISYSETLAHELDKTGVIVRCIVPTFFKSNVLKSAKGDTSIINSANRIVKNSKWSSKDAADHILNNLTERNEFIRFPFSSRLLFFSKTFLPKLFRFIVRRFIMK